ncbi:MAG TPA: hypothetical protein VFF91_13595, partial [Pseudoxanthomonas sp.]|nr:hypothetical protein [Pseudoxanthomonas sp.]
RNLFLLDPLCLLLLPGALALLRGRAPGRLFRGVLWAVAALAALGWVLQWLSLQPQYNLPWIALLLPLHLALALALGRDRPAR